MVINNKNLYESKDVKRILGVKPEEVHLWSRTWGLFEPAIRGKAHGKNRYSLENLMQIALIKELLQWGMGLAAIQAILYRAVYAADGDGPYFYGPKKQRAHSIWKYIGATRERFEREGCVFVLDKNPVGARKLFGNKRGGEIGIFPQIALLKQSLSSLWSFCFDGDGNTTRNFVGVLMIDLMNIIHDVEIATGDKLGDSP